MSRFFDKLIRSIALRKVAAEASFVMKRKDVALRAEMHRRALKDTADFVEANMTTALSCQSRLEHLTYVATHIKDGHFLEFGVFSGQTINHMAGIFPNRTLYGFDSFEGLPEAWFGSRYNPVNFDRKGSMPKVKTNVKLIAGWFDSTLPAFLQANPGPVAFAHVDCDIYSSTKTVLELLAPRFVPGSVIAFDEFFNYPNFRQHEIKAFFEFVERHRVKFDYIGYAGEQVSVRIAEIYAR
ncbi:MAG: TylF/MycF/NovP-related O-methyltransferase [Opitutaceae bacterium]|jgi:predicted O-methyltransferase YrrM